MQSLWYLHLQSAGEPCARPRLPPFLFHLGHFQSKRTLGTVQRSLNPLELLNSMVLGYS